LLVSNGKCKLVAIVLYIDRTSVFQPTTDKVLFLMLCYNKYYYSYFWRSL